MAVPMLVPLSAISKFVEKIDADPDWFPGKKAQTRITHRHMQLLYCLVFWQQLLGESIVGAGNIRSTNPDVSDSDTAECNYEFEDRCKTDVCIDKYILLRTSSHVGLTPVCYIECRTRRSSGTSLVSPLCVGGGGG